LIRSIGTDHARDPHTGVTRLPPQGEPLPSGAVSIPDADLIARMAAKGKPLTASVTLTPRFTGQ
jgi:hypothetical protein